MTLASPFGQISQVLGKVASTCELAFGLSAIKKNGILQLAVPLEASDVNTICTQYPEETEQARLRGYIYTETHTTTDGVTELSLDRAGKAAEGTRYGN